MPTTVDTSSYNTTPQPAMNPLQMLSGAAGLQNTLNQNKLFQQQYNTNIGLGQIYKQAIDPNTGQLDTGKVNSLIAQNPNVTLALPQAIQNSQEAQQRNININSGQLANAQAHVKALTGYFGPIANNPNPSVNDVIHAATDAVNNKMASATEAWSVLDTLPTTNGKPLSQGGTVDPSSIKPWAQQNLLRVMSAQEQMNATNPAPQLVQTGQGQLPMRLPQIGNPSVAGPAIPNLPAPTQQVYNPATRQMEFVGNQPNGGMGNGGGVGLAPGTAAAPPQGSSAASDVVGAASANQGVGLQQRADAVPQTKALLGNLESELKDFNPGPGADWSKVAGAFSNRLMQNFGLQGVDAKAISSQEQFNKMGGMIAQSQFQSLGGTGTDKQLGSTELTSPNSELSKLGNKGIIAMLKGNEDAINTKNQAWQSWLQSGHGPETYGQFSTQFNKSYDPRVFQSQYLAPEDNKKMLTGMTKEEQKNFLNSYRTALSNGWVKLPGAQ